MQTGARPYEAAITSNKIWPWVLNLTGSQWKAAGFGLMLSFLFGTSSGFWMLHLLIAEQRVLEEPSLGILRSGMQWSGFPLILIPIIYCMGADVSDWQIMQWRLFFCWVLTAVLAAADHRWRINADPLIRCDLNENGPVVMITEGVPAAATGGDCNYPTLEWLICRKCLDILRISCVKEHRGREVGHQLGPSSKILPQGSHQGSARLCWSHFPEL